MSKFLPLWLDKHILGPNHMLISKWSSRYNAVSSQNITHLNHFNLFEVSSDIIISGTIPLSLYIPCAVFSWMYNSCSKQSSQSTLAAFNFIIFLPEPFFSSFISFSVAFDHWVNGPVCCKWYEVSLSFLLNLPWIIFSALSQIIVGVTTSHKKAGTMPHEICFSASLRTSLTNQNKWQISVHTCCLFLTLCWQTMYHCTSYAQAFCTLDDDHYLDTMMCGMSNGI